MNLSKLKDVYAKLGPGIITASAAIGTSHLIQSTRAGGYFGFDLLWLIILVNIIKYPFIEYGFRYTAANNENIINGYYKNNKKLLIIFIILNSIAAIGAISAIAYLCANIIKSVFDLNLNNKIISLFVILICFTIVHVGKYQLLDKVMKLFMTILFFTTLLAVILALGNADIESFTSKQSAFSIEHLPFLIALMGWMPGPIELSVWNSLWLEDKKKTKNLTFSESRRDFNIGYFLMVITAVFFLSLGAIIIHNSSEQISSNGVIFTQQFISLYTLTIGDWSKLLVSSVTIIAIFSTILAVIDIYPKTTYKSIYLFNSNIPSNFLFSLCFCTISFFIILLFVNNFKLVIDIVTIIAFLSSPVFAFMNYKLIYSDLMQDVYKPPLYLKILSWFGFAYMIFFCLLFLFSKFL